MAKAKMVRYVAVMDGYDKEAVSDLQLFVKTTLKGSCDKVETKTVKGVQKTGVGIVIPQKMMKGLVNLAAPCWTMYSKGEVDVAEVEPKPEPKKAEPKKPEPIEDSSGEEGYNTGLPELDRYLSKVEDRVSPNELRLLIPSGINPRFEGYAAFTRNGERPLCGGRVPEGGLS